MNEKEFFEKKIEANFPYERCIQIGDLFYCPMDKSRIAHDIAILNESMFEKLQKEITKQLDFKCSYIAGAIAVLRALIPHLEKAVTKGDLCLTIMETISRIEENAGDFAELLLAKQLKH